MANVYACNKHGRMYERGTKCIDCERENKVMVAIDREELTRLRAEVEALRIANAELASENHELKENPDNGYFRSLRVEVESLRKTQLLPGEVRARRVNCKFAPKSNATWCEECVEPLGCSWIVEVMQ